MSDGGKSEFFSCGVAFNVWTLVEYVGNACLVKGLQSNTVESLFSPNDEGLLNALNAKKTKKDHSPMVETGRGCILQGEWMPILRNDPNLFRLRHTATPFVAG